MIQSVIVFHNLVKKPLGLRQNGLVFRRGELPKQLLLGLVKPLGNLHQHKHELVAATFRSPVGKPESLEPEHLPVLRARFEAFGPDPDGPRLVDYELESIQLAREKFGLVGGR